MNKKTFKYLAVVAISLTLLSGCSNPRADILAKAQTAYVKGDLETARTYFEEANRMQPLDTNKESSITNQYHDTMNKLYLKYVADGDSNKYNKKFNEALSDYKKALEISPDDTKLPDTIKATQDLANAQSSLNDYAKLISPIFSKSNQILTGFNSILNSRIIGAMNMQQFKDKVKEIIPQANTITSSLGNGFTSIAGDLAPIHQNVISLVQAQNDMLVNALDDNISASELSNQYMDIKKQQADVLKQLQDYADGKGIAFKMVASSQQQN